MERQSWIGRTPGVRLAYAQIQEASATELPVFIVGEPGTGRRLAARTLHALSTRSGGPFVHVDCEALHREQASAMLFGDPPGMDEAHSEPLRAELASLRRPVPSARLQLYPPRSAPASHRSSRTRGAVGQARGGTLFLESVEALPLSVQEQILLRIAASPKATEGAGDVRVVACSDADLGKAARNGIFCAELYYRLAIVTVRLPPLRERLEDLADLTGAFVRDLGILPHSDAFPVSREVLAVLERYSWPGNIWELKSVLRRAAVLYGSQPLSPRRIQQLLLEGSGISASEAADRPVPRSS